MPILVHVEIEPVVGLKPFRGSALHAVGLRMVRHQCFIGSPNALLDTVGHSPPDGQILRSFAWVSVTAQNPDNVFAVFIAIANVRPYALALAGVKDFRAPGPMYF